MSPIDRLTYSFLPISQNLLQALEALRQSTELQQLQSDELVDDLKRANTALINAFEKAKRKYLARIKKLEGQIPNSTASSMPTNVTSTACVVSSAHPDPLSSNAPSLSFAHNNRMGSEMRLGEQACVINSMAMSYAPSQNDARRRLTPHNNGYLPTTNTAVAGTTTMTTSNLHSPKSAAFPTTSNKNNTQCLQNQLDSSKSQLMTMIASNPPLTSPRPTKSSESNARISHTGQTAINRAR